MGGHGRTWVLLEDKEGHGRAWEDMNDMEGHDSTGEDMVGQYWGYLSMLEDMGH